MDEPKKKSASLGILDVVALIALLAVLAVVAGMLYELIPICFEFGRDILN